MHTCTCTPECTAQTDHTFAAGHQRKLVGYLMREYAKGALTRAQARQEAIERGASSALLSGQIMPSLDRVDATAKARSERVLRPNEVRRIFGDTMDL